MPDMEKVINGLDCHRIDNNHRITCDDCPYYVDDGDHIQCVNDLHDDAITLLKEQDAIESIDFGDKTEIMANLEGLTWDDWRMYHSDTEVQNIAKSAFDLLIALLKKQEAKPVKVVKNAYNHEFYYCPKCDRSFYETWLKKPKFCDECGQAVIFK